MRILAVADTVSKYLYDHYTPGKLDGFDLILACGDLRRDYLEFLVDAAGCPALYVRGNHDDALLDDPPGGCVCIEDKVVVHQGVRILGLGGSQRYREGRNQFTEQQMARRIRLLRLQIWRRGGIDILVTHAPARHHNDLDDVTHQGFECFNDLIQTYRPKFFVHGHIHTSYGVRIPQRSNLGDTVVINACNYCIFEYDPSREI